MGEFWEQISDFFYDPEVYWTAPLALVAARAAFLRLRAWVRREQWPMERKLLTKHGRKTGNQSMHQYRKC
jgi:hypothetical protein